MSEISREIEGMSTVPAIILNEPEQSSAGFSLTNRPNESPIKYVENIFHISKNENISYLHARFQFRVFRSDQVFEMRSDLDPVLKKNSDQDPVF